MGLNASRYTQNPQVAYQVLDGQAALVTHLTSEFYSLNPTATVLWEAMHEPATLAELGAVVSSRFEVEVEQATDDAGAFVREFLARGLIYEVLP